MYRLVLHLFLLLCFPVEITWSTTVTVTPSITAFSTPVSIATSQTPVLQTPAASSVSPSASPSTVTASTADGSSPSSFISAEETSSSLTVQSTFIKPTVAQSPSASASVGPTSGGTQARGPDTTSSPSGSGKGKTIGGLETVGFCLVAVLVVLITAFAIYYFFFRKRLYPEYWNELEPEAPPPGPEVASKEVSVAVVAAAGTKKAAPEVGITHQGFVGEEEVPPVYISGPASNTQEKGKENNKNGGIVENTENKQGGEGTENVGFTEDSTL